MDILLFMILCHLDPCFQPIGISNGLAKIIREKAKKASRFITPLEGCSGVSYVYGNFITSMTIKGIAFRSTRNIELNLLYAFMHSDPWISLRKSLDQTRQVSLISGCYYYTTHVYIAKRVTV